MRAKTVPSRLLIRNGRRFDTKPYMSGALEARDLLDRLAFRKDPLQAVTKDGPDGIVNAGRVRRLWVEAPRYGLPFMSSSDILQADLSTLPHIARRVVDAYPQLVIHEGWTLITRSGTIGRMVYARPDMDGMACSEHVMRVIPDPEKIPSGYLFAFLSSEYGVPLIVSGTYGSIIQSIEPHHIADLPVPRLGHVVEGSTDNHVREAAQLRVEANELLKMALKLVYDLWQVAPNTITAHTRRQPDIEIVSIKRIAAASRLDAFYFGQDALLSDAILEEMSQRMRIATVGEIASEVFETARFSRIPVSDLAYGVAFLSISDLVQFDPSPSAHISKRQAGAMRATVKPGWLILPRVGQLNGVFGTVCFIPEHLNGVAVSDNNIRIVPHDEETGAYLWAALSTNVVYQQIIRRACGTSIPYIDSKRIASLPIPWPDREQRRPIAQLVRTAMRKRSEASAREKSALNIVEQAIEGAS